MIGLLGQGRSEKNDFILEICLPVKTVVSDMFRRIESGSEAIKNNCYDESLFLTFFSFLQYSRLQPHEKSERFQISLPAIGRNVLIETLMEKIKAVIVEQFEIESRGLSNLSALLLFLFRQDNGGLNKSLILPLNSAQFVYSFRLNF